MKGIDMRIIYESKDKFYRVIELVDTDPALADHLKGDLFKPEYMAEMHNKNMTIDKLRKLEIAFERKVAMEGVYGYVLEKWDSNPGMGYEDVDSCFGFIGQFDASSKEFNHYIVKELIEQIPEKAHE